MGDKYAVIAKARRLKEELIFWGRKGFPIASDEIRAARESACSACKYYDPKGNLLLGECTAPGCGCTRFKWWLATSKCPHPNGSKWPDIDLTNL
jgi:hypothetical protein